MSQPRLELMEGDLIFQTSLSEQSRAIQMATQSKYSHMGIIYKDKDQYYVYEAIGPVKLTPLTEWIKRGKDRHFVVKRLKNAKRLLDEETIEKMKKIGDRFLGKKYDLYFEWSDDRIYCSELVWKIYKEALGIEISPLQRFEEFDFSSHVVQEKLTERFGDNLPLDEPVISPGRIFESDALMRVLSK